MMTRQKTIQTVATVLVVLFLISPSIPQIRAESSFEELQIDFGSPSATFPLDKTLKHRFTVKTIGAKTLMVEFGIINKDTNQGIVGWPQPQFLYLEPQEEKIVQTFVGENYRTAPIGEYQTTAEWSFRDLDTRAERKHLLTYKFTVLGEESITGNLKLSGKVINGNNQPVADVPVKLSTSPGGWSTQTTTQSDGTFIFSGVPERDDWLLEAWVGGETSGCLPPPNPCMSSQPSTQQESSARAFAFVEPNKTDYTLTLKESTLKASYQVTKAEKTEIGFWKGDVDNMATNWHLLRHRKNQTRMWVRGNLLMFPGMEERLFIPGEILNQELSVLYLPKVL